MNYLYSSKLRVEKVRYGTNMACLACETTDSSRTIWAELYSPDQWLDSSFSNSQVAIITVRQIARVFKICAATDANCDDLKTYTYLYIC